MKKYLFLVIMLMTASLYAQDIQRTKPIKVLYKSGDQIIQSSPIDDGFDFIFQDERYNHIDAIEKMHFANKESLLHFFNKVVEVQNEPETEKSENLIVTMSDFVENEKEVKIIRFGEKQFVTYIYLGNSFTIIPKTYLKRLIKKINE